MDWQLIFMVIGFSFASYSIIANDAIQTLGTFLASNHNRPWWVLWLFAATILTLVLMYGWHTHGGDPSYNRLDRIPIPPDGIEWYFIVPPIVILILTRYGVPVSTTFLTLSVFVASNNPEVIQKMVLKSILGYGVAFACAFVLARFVLLAVERYFLKTHSDDEDKHPIWVILQWISTGFLWSQWLMQDLANIFAFTPRKLDLTTMIAATGWICALLAIIFYIRGGSIQRIVTSKRNSNDIRSATIIDFQYGVILYIFKNLNNIPMSTTWVFLGLLAGREIALCLGIDRKIKKKTYANVGRDTIKLILGLAVSIALAFGLPAIEKLIDAPAEEPATEQMLQSGEF
ncbi:hypothetical protein H5P28_10785 [Ruficoccus amylovorans]|uniref:Phosphate/sulfate permease n=1 Tax=Ruficoccus amylovorans TaxID=1804625 RepID=A0A842HGJ4_9BACT|nr:hypothetical protein [Ruficoccus amylovorans]MBC2594746.1 hypothetical protein [Ruficoccus amylovorans]